MCIGIFFPYLSVLFRQSVVFIIQFIAHFFGLLFLLFRVDLEEEEFVRVIGGPGQQHVAQFLVTFPNEKRLSQALHEN